MGVLTFTNDFTSKVPARRLFKATILDNKFLPKIMPQYVKSIELVEGNGGPGSFNLLHFVEGSKEKYLKQRVDALDVENMTYKYTVTEGDDDFMKKYESVTTELKFEATPDGGCKGTEVTKLTPKAGVEFNEEEFKAGRAIFLALHKAGEAYLLANPQAYA